MIDPDRWEGVIQARNEKKPAGVTNWFNGKTAPVRKGWYERMFTDGIYRHFWDGKLWRAMGSDGLAHWRQVGDYPLWRGLTSSPVRAAASLQETK